MSNVFIPMSIAPESLRKLDRERIVYLARHLENKDGILINEEDLGETCDCLNMNNHVLRPLERGIKILCPKKEGCRVRTGTWDGQNVNDFKNIAIKFAERINKDVLIVVPHGMVGRPNNHSEEFTIHVWACPISTTRRKPPEKMFGFEVACRDNAFTPSRRLDSEVIKAGNYPVAELVNKNDLYIYHDLVHEGDDSEFKIFAKILEKTELFFQPQSFKLDKVVEKSKFEIICQDPIAERVKSLQTSIRKSKSSLEKMRKQLDSVTQGASLFMKTVELTKDNHSFAKEFDNLFACDKIDKIRVSGKTVTVYTEELFVTDPRTDRIHTLGKMKITLDFGFYDESVDYDDDDEIVIYDKITQGLISSPEFEGMMAPHVFYGGNPCWGNHYDTMRELFVRCDVPAAIFQAIRFLESVNVDDQAGAYVCYWPYKGESKLHHETRIEDQCVNCQIDCPNVIHKKEAS